MADQPKITMALMTAQGLATGPKLLREMYDAINSQAAGGNAVPFVGKDDAVTGHVTKAWVRGDEVLGEVTFDG